MEIKPVKNIETPKYPLKDEMSEKTLKESVPKRWTESKAAKVALGTIAVVTLAGCYAGAPLPPSIVTEGSCVTNTPDITYERTAGVPESPSTPTVSYMPEGTTAPATLNVAPLFTHGDGRAAFGGDMASMPAVISEDEALSIINNTAKEYGLSFSAADAPVFSNVRQPVTDLSSDDPVGEEQKGQGDMISLKADFFDSKHGIAIQFVSVDDVKEWGGGHSNSLTAVYDTKDAAEQLSESLEEAYNYKKITAAVLYDPCESAKKKSDAEALSKADIKAQAKDFFDWLKSQEII